MRKMAPKHTAISLRYSVNILGSYTTQNVLLTLITKYTR